MPLIQTRLHAEVNEKDLASIARTGVSLHCHTRHSKENLDFLPHYCELVPVLAHFWRRERRLYRKREGREIDFHSAYWTPPLGPDEVFTDESKQLSDAGLRALVSITDHDCIDGCIELSNSGIEAPISMEWTVPFQDGFFHLGIHNMPSRATQFLMNVLLEFSDPEGDHTSRRLSELFSMLNEAGNVLIVLNHPLWDIEMVGRKRHNELLTDFLGQHGSWLHGIEINGFRSWTENKAVLRIAEALEIPIVAGGDRHGCKPNSMINLSNRETFDEFVDEIRTDKRTEVALLPEYRQPLISRQFRTASEVLGLFPEFSESRRHWMGRIYFDVGCGKGLRSVYDLGLRVGPSWMRFAINAIEVLGSKSLAPLFRGFEKASSFARRDLDIQLLEPTTMELPDPRLRSQPTI